MTANGKTSRRSFRVWLPFLAALMLVASSGLDAQQQPRIKVTAGILPLAYFAERVGQELIEVEVLIGPGQSPATYEPTPKQIVGLAESRLLLLIGVPFEQTLKKKIADNFADLRIVDVTGGVKKIPIADHGHGHDSDDGELDPHVWLDPLRAMVIADNIADELVVLDPERTAVYRQNAKVLKADLELLHKQIASRLAPYRGRVFVVFHPAFGYFADTFGLKQVAVQIGGKTPGSRSLTGIIASTKKQRIGTIFVQPQFVSRSVQAVADEIGVQVVLLDPLAFNYLENLLTMTDKLEQALGQ